MIQASATTLPAASPPAFERWIGRTHLHPAIDYLLVGGGVTIPIFLAIYFFPGLTAVSPETTFNAFLVFNGAHFAASTVRLYTKRGAKEEFPFLSWGFPLVCLVVLAIGLSWPVLGRNLTNLYLSWSPYHYAAQTYGIAVMYAMKSGARLDDQDKRQIWWVCLLPFLYALVTAKEGGLAWFVSREWLATVPALDLIYQAVVAVLSVGVLTLPLVLFWQLHRMRKKNVPLITVLLQISNGIWWLGTTYLSAWWWTAMLHSIQYLIIVVVLHVREQMAVAPSKPNPLHQPAFYALAFYGLSFVLGVFLFFGVPAAYVRMGFDATESYVLFAVIINLHHFIVDGFIWRNKPRGNTAAPAPRHDEIHAIA